MSKGRKILLSVVSVFTVLPLIAHGKVSQSETKKNHIKISGKAATRYEGVGFQCSPSQIATITEDMQDYFKELKIAPQWVKIRKSQDNTRVIFTLATPETDTNTVNLNIRPEYQIKDDAVQLPTSTPGLMRTAMVVSKKEIALSLLQHGRFTAYSGRHCEAQAFKDNVGIRQNTVAWVEGLGWQFPEDSPASYNPRYWAEPPTPLSGTLHEAILDAFLNEDMYSIGCLTAAKWVMINGILDYYARIRKDDAKVKAVERALMVDGHPLRVRTDAHDWSKYYDINPPSVPSYGKVLMATSATSKWNFVAGDWVYFENLDPKSKSKSGYEGSNAIYLGRAGFNSFYFEKKRGHFTFKEKVQEVYNWRFEEKDRKELPSAMIDRLLDHPETGGLLYNLRIAPMIF